MRSQTTTGAWEGAQQILGALDNVTKKRKLDPTLRKLDELIELLENWEREDAAADHGDSTRASSLSALRAALSSHDARAVLQSHHKELVTAATKLSKVTDKAIGTNVEGVLPAGMTLDTALVNHAIHQHLLISGRFAVAERFAVACGLDMSQAAEAALKQMHAVRDALEAGETAPLAEWLAQHQGSLPAQRSASLAFDLCQLRFVRLLKSGDSAGALALLRRHVASRQQQQEVVVADRVGQTVAEVAVESASSSESARSPPDATQPRAHATSSAASGSETASQASSSLDAPPRVTLPLPTEARVRELVGALAFAHRLDSSPYAQALDEARLRDRLAASFTRDCLAMHQLPSESPLVKCVDACSLALPRLAKLATMLKGKYADLCRSGSTLPIDLDLGPSFSFHSTFTCPISKESATRGNPPMLLPCGHVLALGSVTKLARERAIGGVMRGSRSARFKCPYCPAECTMVAAQSLTI